MTYETLATELESRILTITLNRPEAMNSFTVEMAGELVNVFNSASEDDDVGCIIVTGAGKAFCAGMDLSIGGNVFGLDESIRPNLDEVRRRYNDEDMVTGVRDTGGRVSLAIFECKKPVIGAINGAAVGIGATMTCAMDIRLAAEHARIGFVFNKIGIKNKVHHTDTLKKDHLTASATLVKPKNSGFIVMAAFIKNNRPPPR